MRAKSQPQRAGVKLMSYPPVAGERGAHVNWCIGLFCLLATSGLTFLNDPARTYRPAAFRKLSHSPADAEPDEEHDQKKRKVPTKVSSPHR